MGYSGEECYEALREAAERLGKSPSKSEYDDLDLRPCATEIHRVCESWNAAKEAVGLEVHQRSASYTDQDCIDALKQAADRLEKSPSRAEYDELDILPGTTTIGRRFDGWAEAKQAAGLEVLSSGTDREYTKQECIEALQEAADRLDRSPYMYEYDEVDIHPKSNTITKYFGGWNAAKREAGLETYNYTREDCLESLQEAANRLGHSPTKTEYEELGLKPCTGVFDQKFGGWDEAKIKIGLDSRARVTCSEEDCLEAIEDAASILGHPPTSREYLKLDMQPTLHEIKVVFGSWNTAKEQLGFDTVPSSHEITYSEEDCIKALKQVTDQLGVSPTTREYISFGAKPSAKVIKRRFGTWNEAKQAAGLETYMDGSSDGRYYGPNWATKREEAMRRDEYQCLICSTTLEKHVEQYGHSLHVHHIIPFDDFKTYKVANHLSNLAVVCMKCHKPLESKSVEQQCNRLDVPQPTVDASDCWGQQKINDYT